MIRKWLAALCCLGLLSAPVPAFAEIDKLMRGFKHLQSFPACDDAKVLAQIIEKFNWAEENTWQRGIGLTDVVEPRERLVKDSEHRLVPRRYCRGHALLSNGRHPTVLYLIEEGAGFAGTGYNVEFCVNGMDPWRVYDGSCRVLNY